jgi:hypothetical protein
MKEELIFKGLSRINNLYSNREKVSVLEFLNNLCGLGTKYRNKVVVLARQATKAGGIDSLESILGLLMGLKIRALITRPAELHNFGS